VIQYYEHGGACLNRHCYRCAAGVMYEPVVPILLRPHQHRSEQVLRVNECGHYCIEPIRNIQRSHSERRPATDVAVLLQYSSTSSEGNGSPKKRNSAPERSGSAHCRREQSSVTSDNPTGEECGCWFATRVRSAGVAFSRTPFIESLDHGLRRAWLSIDPTERGVSYSALFSWLDKTRRGAHLLFLVRLTNHGAADGRPVSWARIVRAARRGRLGRRAIG
jgi:hypothetical protein